MLAQRTSPLFGVRTLPPISTVLREELRNRGPPKFVHLYFPHQPPIEHDRANGKNYGVIFVLILGDGRWPYQWFLQKIHLSIHPERKGLGEKASLFHPTSLLVNASFTVKGDVVLRGASALPSCSRCVLFSLSLFFVSLFLSCSYRRMEQVGESQKRDTNTYETWKWIRYKKTQNIRTLRTTGGRCTRLQDCSKYF